MNADGPDETLTGPALDREIRAALAVDPSPEFVARLRTRIASEPARATSRLSWKLAAAAVFAAAIVIGVVLSRPHEVSTLPADRMPLQARAVAPFSQLVFVASDSSRTEVAVASGFSRTMARSAEAFARQPTEPEVLIDPREAQALRRLIAGVRDGRVDLSPVLRASTPTAMELPPLDDIVISPITIESLAPLGGAEGVRQ